MSARIITLSDNGNININVGLCLSVPLNFIDGHKWKLLKELGVESALIDFKIDRKWISNANDVNVVYTDSW